MYVLQIITSRESKSNTHTLWTDPRWRKWKKQKLAKTNKSTHCNVTEERLSSRRRRRVGGRRLVKYRITLSVTEKERERDSERKRRRMFVCDNILNKKRESKDLSLTDKQNTRENKNQLEINTLEAYDEGCWKLVRMLTCGQAFSFTPGLESWTP